MKIAIGGVERSLTPEAENKLLKICNELSTPHPEMVMSILENFIENFPLQRYCPHCGCEEAKYLGDLVSHKGDCPNIPF